MKYQGITILVIATLYGVQFRFVENCHTVTVYKWPGNRAAIDKTNWRPNYYLMMGKPPPQWYNPPLLPIPTVTKLPSEQRRKCRQRQMPDCKLDGDCHEAWQHTKYGKCIPKGCKGGKCPHCAYWCIYDPDWTWKKKRTRRPRRPSIKRTDVEPGRGDKGTKRCSPKTPTSGKCKADQPKMSTRSRRGAPGVRPTVGAARTTRPKKSTRKQATRKPKTRPKKITRKQVNRKHTTRPPRSTKKRATTKPGAPTDQVPNCGSKTNDDAQKKSAREHGPVNHTTNFIKMGDSRVRSNRRGQRTPLDILSGSSDDLGLGGAALFFRGIQIKTGETKPLKIDTVHVQDVCDRRLFREEYDVTKTLGGGRPHHKICGTYQFCTVDKCRPSDLPDDYRPYYFNADVRLVDRTQNPTHDPDQIYAQFNSVAECNLAELKYLQVGSKVRRCGIGSMLTYICMTDNAVLGIKPPANIKEIRTYVFWNKLEGYQWENNPAFGAGTNLFGRIQSTIDEKLQCRRLFCIDSSKGNEKTFNPLAVLAFLYAAMDAEYRWVVAVGHHPPNAPTVDFHSLKTLIADISPTNTIVNSDEAKKVKYFKLIFCKQFSLEKVIFEPLSSNQQQSYFIPKRYNGNCKFTKDISAISVPTYKVKKYVDDHGLYTFDVTFFGDRVIPLKGYAYIQCRNGNIQIPQIVDGALGIAWDCGMEALLAYLCMIDQDVMADKIGYKHEIMSTITSHNGAVEGSLTSLENEKFRQCNQVAYFLNTAERPVSKFHHLKVKEQLNAATDARYTKMFVTKLPMVADPREYDTEQELISVMKNLQHAETYYDRYIFFCKPDRQ